MPLNYSLKYCHLFFGVLAKLMAASCMCMYAYLKCRDSIGKQQKICIQKIMTLTVLDRSMGKGRPR